MISGTVGPNREALVRLKVSGPSGEEQEIEAVIDTGFSGQFTLPPALISKLRLTWLSQGQAIMANGQVETFDIYAIVVLWDGRPLRIMAEQADTEPMIGMSLLFACKLTLEIVDSGLVTIERIEVKT